MSPYRIEILVTPRPGLLDPEGNAIQHALHSLGYDDVEEVRVGKAIYLHVEAESEEEALEEADEMCRKVLANPVTEDYEIQLVDAGESRDPAAEPASAGSGPPGAEGGRADG